MSKKTLILIPVLLAITAGAYLMLNRRDDEATTTSSAEPLGDSEIAPVSPSTAPPVPNQNGQASVNTVPKVFCDHETECANNPLTPNSAEELRWMQQHGYPTTEESERLSRLSESELEAEAKRGVLTAMSELGTRMIDRGNTDGFLWYISAADQGSIHVYYNLSDATMKLKRPGFGITEAGAYLRVAYLLGDYKAGAALNQFISTHGLGLTEMEVIDKRAASLYKTYAKSRQPTPRPH